MTDPHLQTYQTLLDRFVGFPPSEPAPRSFLEIAGFPNYENVISNVLAYFFDREESHNLQDLLVKAMLLQAGQAVDTVRETLVEREVYTPKNKRIDLLIQTEAHILVIENKIYAKLYNDLAEYAAYAKKLAGNSGKTVVNLVLSPFKMEVSEEMERHHFRPVAYADFFTGIRNLLGQYIQNVNLDALAILRDFMAGMEKRYAYTMQNRELYSFFAEHQDQIESLFQAYQDGQKGFAAEINALSTLLVPEADADRKINQYVYRKVVLVHDIALADGNTVCAEIQRRYGGWQINVFVRGKNFHPAWHPELLRKTALLHGADLDSKRMGNKIRWETIPEQTDPGTVATRMKELMDQIRYKKPEE